MGIPLHDELIAQARRAAIGLASAHGLSVDSADVLSFASNVILRLHPHDLVARVSGGAALIRPDGEGPQRAVEVCGFLIEAGAPVVAPSNLIDPGPHEFEGSWVTFWEGLSSGAQTVSMAGALASLRQCHAALTSFPGTLPYMRGYDATRHVFHGLWQGNQLDSINPGETVQRLAVIDEALAAKGGASSPHNVPLHGDAHLGNVLMPAPSAGQTGLWLDWEDVCVGPIEWDYACMAASLDGNENAFQTDPAFLTAIADEIDPELLDVMIDARLLQRDVWDTALKMLYRNNAPAPGLLRRGLGFARRKIGLF